MEQKPTVDVKSVVAMLVESADKVETGEMKLEDFVKMGIEQLEMLNPKPSPLASLNKEPAPMIAEDEE